MEQKSLVKQAEVHFENLMNIRRWSASYDGVYVKPHIGQAPNPFLEDNVLRAEGNTTLLRVNAAWMTRQLSEISNTEGFSFTITDLHPLNPLNQAGAFEIRALETMRDTQTARYFEFDDRAKAFKYLHAIEIEERCLRCHHTNGYVVGEIRSGISISLDSDHYYRVIAFLEQDNLFKKGASVALALLLAYFYIRLLKRTERAEDQNYRLEMKVDRRIRETQRTKQLFQGVLDADMSLMAVSDRERLVFANKTFLHFFGYDDVETFAERYPNLSVLFIEREETGFVQPMQSESQWVEYLLEHQESSVWKVSFKHQGPERVFRPHVSRLNVTEEHYYLITFDEITDHVIEKNRLKKAALTDPLTGLANRAHFDQIIDTEVARYAKTGKALSVIVVDIDHFKSVNDTFGHDIGDQVLQASARLFEGVVRKSDVIVRWGGEEFVLVLPTMQHGDAIRVAEKVCERFRRHVFEHVGRVSVSCGVAEYRGGEDVKELLRRADEALYKAKAGGRDQVCCEEGVTKG